MERGMGVLELWAADFPDLSNALMAQKMRDFWSHMEARLARLVFRFLARVSFGHLLSEMGQRLGIKQSPHDAANLEFVIVITVSIGRGISITQTTFVVFRLCANMLGSQSNCLYPGSKDSGCHSIMCSFGYHPRRPKVRARCIRSWMESREMTDANISD